MRRAYRLASEALRGAFAAAHGVPPRRRRGTWWDADHIVPIAEGGTNVLENLRTLCLPCHARETRALGTRMRPASATIRASAGFEADMHPTQKSDAEWRRELEPDRYAVLRQAATEPAFSGALYHNESDGTYRCGACRAPLFSSQAKFESGSGWPSFYEPNAHDGVKLVEDRSHGMVRVEARCAACDSHLGHVFDDGPEPTGKRYCINSLALDFAAGSEPAGS